MTWCPSLLPKYGRDGAPHRCSLSSKQAVDANVCRRALCIDDFVALMKVPLIVWELLEEWHGLYGSSPHHRILKKVIAEQSYGGAVKLKLEL